MSPPLGSAPRLGIVNGLRGCAILAVIYGHLLAPYILPGGVEGRTYDTFNGYYFSVFTLATNSWMGVNLFFVLSGFVLSLPYELGQRQMSSQTDARDFLFRRAVRLLPLYYLCIAFALFAQTRSNWVSVGPPAYIARVLTFTFVYHEPHFITFFNVPLWSLAAEVAFSLVFPVLLVLFRRFGPRITTALVFALSLGIRVYATTHRLGEATPLESLKDSPMARLDDFVLGMLVCHVYVKGKAWPPARSLASFSLGFVLIVLSSLGWDNVQLRTLPYVAGAVLHDFTNLGFALVLIGLLHAPAFLRRAFSVAPLQLCGMMCYSLYIWHMFGIDLAGPKWPANQQVYALAAVLFLSTLTYRYVEFRQVPLKKLFWEFAS